MLETAFVVAARKSRQANSIIFQYCVHSPRDLGRPEGVQLWYNFVGSGSKGGVQQFPSLGIASEKSQSALLRGEQG